MWYGVFRDATLIAALARISHSIELVAGNYSVVITSRSGLLFPNCALAGDILAIDIARGRNSNLATQRYLRVLRTDTSKGNVRSASRLRIWSRALAKIKNRSAGEQFSCADFYPRS